MREETNQKIQSHQKMIQEYMDHINMKLGEIQHFKETLKSQNDMGIKTGNALKVIENQIDEYNDIISEVRVKEEKILNDIERKYGRILKELDNQFKNDPNFRSSQGGE